MFDLNQAIREWTRRLRRNQAMEEADVAEIESHLRDEIDRQMGAGLSEEAAFDAAVALSAPVEELGREYGKFRFHQQRYPFWHPARFISGLAWSYVQIGLRRIRRQKGYSFINIAGLAVGMACCILIYLWVKDELSFDKFHPHYKQLYKVAIRVEGEWWDMTPWALAPTLKKDFGEIKKATRICPRDFLVSYEDKSLYRRVVFVDPDFLEMFGFPLRAGSRGSALAAKQSAVLTEKTAKALFGNAEPMGKTLSINVKDFQVPVTAIAKDPPMNTVLPFDVLIPVKILGDALDADWSYESFCYVLLEEKASLADVRKKIAPVVMKYDTRMNSERILDLQPLTRSHLYNLGGGGAIVHVYIFATVAVFILLMACINFMNLATARAGKRAKEVGLRKVVGARKSDVVRQFYGESFLHAGLALAAAVSLVLLVLPAFNHLAEKSLRLSLVSDAGVLLALLVITLVTGLVSGSYPALFLSSFRPALILKNALALGSSKSRLRKPLVVVQFSIGIILLIGTAAVYRQLNYMRSIDLGYNRYQVVTMTINRQIRPKFQTFKDELLRDTDVVNVTAASSQPTWVSNANQVWWEGRAPGQYETMNFVAADYDYVKTFKMEIVAGRDISRGLATDAENYIVNEAAVRRMGFKDPVGKLFSIFENKGKIIGVIKDFNNKPLSQEITPTVITFRPDFTPFFSYLFVRVRPENVNRTIDRIKNTWTRFAPDFPFEPVFLDQSFDDLYRADRRMGIIFRDFAALAIFISCLGIFGLAAFTAEQRTKEIGIRKVLGASIARTVSLISREFVILVTIANLIAGPTGFYLAHQLLQSYAYRTSVPFWIVLGAGILAYLIALLTVSYQAVKASVADPVNALKYE